MKLYYKEGLPVYTKSGNITNFSSVDEIEVEFEPTDLFIELGSEDIDALTYVQNFIDNLGESKQEALDLIKSGIEFWKTKSDSSVDCLLAKKGSDKVSKIIDKIKI